MEVCARHRKRTESAEARTNTYEDRGKKIAKLSNPGEEGGPMDQALQDCDVIID